MASGLLSMGIHRAEMPVCRGGNVYGDGPSIGYQAPDVQGPISWLIGWATCGYVVSFGSGHQPGAEQCRTAATLVNGIKHEPQLI